MLGSVQNSLLSLIYPQECRVCSGLVEKHDDGVSCTACWNATRIFNGCEMLCQKCGAFFGEKAAPAAVFCHQCNDDNYDKAAALGIYENALAAAIVQLKKVPSFPKRLHNFLSGAPSAAFENVDVIIPIPLSRLRERERGFNQAEMIAAAVSRVTRAQVDKHTLARKLNTPMHRVGMDRKARALTVKNAFEVTRPRMMEGRNILLVDDVFTSGATASSCAKVLKKHGAGNVNVFTLARAVMN